LRPYLERIVFGIEDDWMATITNLFTDAVAGVIEVFQEVDRFVRGAAERLTNGESVF